MGARTRWRRERRVRNAATLGLVVLGPVLAGLTYVVLGPLHQGASSTALRIVLLADLVYVLSVAALVAREVSRVFRSTRSQGPSGPPHSAPPRPDYTLSLAPRELPAPRAVAALPPPSPPQPLHDRSAP